MAQENMTRLVAALKTGAGLKDDFIYYMPFDDYKTLPDPFPRTRLASRKFKKAFAAIPIRKSPASCFSGISTAGSSRRPKYRSRIWLS